MKYVRPALAALAFTLMAGCGGQITPHSLVGQLQDVGYSCTFNDSDLKEDSRNAYSCSGAWAFVYYNKQEVAEYGIWPSKYGQYAKGSFSLGNDSYPMWTVLCMDDACVEAARKVGWR